MKGQHWQVARWGAAIAKDPVTREYYGAYIKREEDRARDEAEDRAIRRMENGGYDG